MLDILTSNSVVAENMKRIISDKGLKQASIALKAGFTPQELNDMLNGRRIMRAIDIAQILEVLKDVGVDANDLFGLYAAGKKGE